MPRKITVLCLLAALSVNIAGCGGGGRAENLEAGVISGTVTDIAGNLIPGAVVSVVGGRGSTKSLMNGTYKVGVSTDFEWVTLRAEATIGGREWIGFRAVQVFTDGPTQSQNIVIAPVQDMGGFRGTVVDTIGQPIEGARIFATARFPEVPAEGENPAQVTLVAITGSDGNYEISGVPATIDTEKGLQRIVYKVTASSAGRSGQARGFDNGVADNVTLDPGTEVRIDFTLAASASVPLLEEPVLTIGSETIHWTDPGAILALSFTLPSNITSRSYGGYRGVMATVSPRMRKALEVSRKTSRVPPPGSIIEINVIWNGFDWAAVNDNVAGFGIYRRASDPPAKSDKDQIDFVRDPDLLVYSDTSAALSVGIDYFYGVTAVSTSYLDANNNFNPESESEMSGIAQVRPIGQLRLLEPPQNAVYSSGNMTFSWQALSGARGYQLLIYDDYPIFEVSTTLFDADTANDFNETTPSENRPTYLPRYLKFNTTGTSQEVTTLRPGTYYWTVVAGNRQDLENEATSYSIGELRRITIR